MKTTRSLLHSIHPLSFRSLPDEPRRGGDGQDDKRHHDSTDPNQRHGILQRIRPLALHLAQPRLLFILPRELLRPVLTVLRRPRAHAVAPSFRHSRDTASTSGVTFHHRSRRLHRRRLHRHRQHRSRSRARECGDVTFATALGRRFPFSRSNDAFDGVRTPSNGNHRTRDKKRSTARRTTLIPRCPRQRLGSSGARVARAARANRGAHVDARSVRHEQRARTRERRVCQRLRASAERNPRTRVAETRTNAREKVQSGRATLRGIVWRCRRSRRALCCRNEMR